MKNYRCIQLVANIADGCLFDFVIPFEFTMAVFLNTMILYLLISVDFSLMIIIFVISFQSVLLAIYFCIYDRLGMFLEVSKEIQDSWKVICETKYISSHLRSLAPVKFRIGAFYYIDRQTVITLCREIFGRTVDLLLLSST